MKEKFLTWLRRVLKWVFIGFGAYVFVSFFILMKGYNPRDIDAFIFGPLFPIAFAFLFFPAFSFLGGYIGYAAFRKNSKEILGSIFGGALSVPFGWITYILMFTSEYKESFRNFLDTLIPIAFAWAYLIEKIYEIFAFAINTISR